MEVKILEAYSIRALRVIFISRHLAGHFGSDLITPGHLILALIYEDQDRMQEALDHPGPLFLTPPAPIRTPFFTPETAAELIREFKATIGAGTSLPADVDMPLRSDAARL